IRGEPTFRDGGWRGHRRLRRDGAPTAHGVLLAAGLVRRHRQHVLRAAVGPRLHGAHDVARGPAPAPDLLVPGADGGAGGLAADRRGSRGAALPARRVVVRTTRASTAFHHVATED